MLLAGAIILLSGGTLGLAFEVGMGVATVFGAARGAAALMRDPRGTVARYLSTQVLQKFSSNTSAIQDKLAKMDAVFWPYNVDELKVNKNLKQNPAFGSGENGNYDKTK